MSSTESNLLINLEYFFGFLAMFRHIFFTVHVYHRYEHSNCAHFVSHTYSTVQQMCSCKFCAKVQTYKYSYSAQIFAQYVDAYKD